MGICLLYVPLFIFFGLVLSFAILVQGNGEASQAEETKVHKAKGGTSQARRCTGNSFFLLLFFGLDRFVLFKTGGSGSTLGFRKEIWDCNTG